MFKMRAKFKDLLTAAGIIMTTIGYVIACAGVGIHSFAMGIAGVAIMASGFVQIIFGD
jgi:hypothetical protein